MSRYLEKVEQVVRSFKRIPPPGYPESTKDDVWDFYRYFLQDAYHLKDWIVYDDSLGVSKKEMDAFIEGNIYMKLLQSVVTGIKHLKANHKQIVFPNLVLTWVDEGGSEPSPAVSCGDLVLGIDEEGYFLLEEDSSTTRVEKQTKTVHPRVLSVKVLEAWNQFLKNHGLDGHFGLS